MNEHERMDKIIKIMNNINQLKSIRREENIQFEHQCSQYLKNGKHLKGEILLHTPCRRILHYDFNDNDATCLIEFLKFI